MINDIYLELEDYYKKQGYYVSINKDLEHLELSLNRKDVSLIIKVKNSYGTINDVSSTLVKLENLNITTQYRIIYLQGFDNSCTDFLQFNCHVTDYSYINEVFQACNSGKTFVELLPHNQSCYDNIQSQLLTSDRVAIEHATGTGKSYIIAKILSSMNYKKVLYIAPTTILLNQTTKTLSAFNIDIDYLTYAQLNTNYKKGDITDSLYDLIIVDEYHRAGAEQWFVAIKALFSLNPKSKKLGLSATPTRYLDNNRNMTDELFNGVVASRLTLVDGFLKKLLPVPTYISCLYNTGNYNAKLREKLNNTSYTEEFKAPILTNIEKFSNLTMNDDMVIETLSKYVDKISSKYIVFCKDKAHMDESMKLFEKWLVQANINSFKLSSIYSSYSNKQNINTINDFKYTSFDGVSILFAIDILNEGIDIDTGINGIFMLRGSESGIVVYQQIGRAIRTTNSYIPTVFDFVNNLDTLNYRTIREDLKTELLKLNNKRNKYNLPPIDVSIKVNEEENDVIALFNTIESKLHDTWLMNYSNLVEFYNQHSHTRVPIKKKEFSQLGCWISKQRNLYRKGLLSQDKIEMLEKIDFIFSVYDQMWMDKYYEYKECLESGANFSNNLSSWASNQRNDFLEGKLSEHQINLLEDINFSFKKKSPKKLVSFEEKAAITKEYIDIYTKESIKSTTIYKDVRIGAWISNLKFLIKNGSLSNDRLLLITKFGIFSKEEIDNILSKPKKYTRWDANFDRFLMLKNLDNISLEDKKWISNWKSKQKRLYKDNALSKDKYLKLKKHIDFSLCVAKQ